MTKPAVISISSHVVRGSVGNRAAAFALEALGFPVWTVPTIVLSWHPGHGAATRIVPPSLAFSALLGDLERAPGLGEVGAILSGYLGHADQAEPVSRLVKAVKANNPCAIYVCDPVIGDEDGLYVPQATAEAIRDLLLPLADIATPNFHEFEWLTRKNARTAGDVIAAARSAGGTATLVTSTPANDDRLGNLYVDRHQAFLVAHDVVPSAPNGAGDLTAALFLAHRLNGHSTGDALRLTTSSVLECLRAAVGRGAAELMLETDARLLGKPVSELTLQPVLVDAALKNPR